MVLFLAFILFIPRTIAVAEINDANALVQITMKPFPWNYFSSDTKTVPFLAPEVPYCIKDIVLSELRYNRMKTTPVTSWWKLWCPRHTRTEYGCSGLYSGWGPFCILDSTKVRKLRETHPPKFDFPAGLDWHDCTAEVMWKGADFEEDPKRPLLPGGMGMSYEGEGVDDPSKANQDENHGIRQNPRVPRPEDGEEGGTCWQIQRDNLVSTTKIAMKLLAYLAGAGGCHANVVKGLKMGKKMIKGLDLLVRNMLYMSEAKKTYEEGGDTAGLAWEGMKMGVENLQTTLGVEKQFQHVWRLLNEERESSEDDAKRSSSTSSKRSEEADKGDSEEADKGGSEEADNDGSEDKDSPEDDPDTLDELSTRMDILEAFANLADNLAKYYGYFGNQETEGDERYWRLAIINLVDIITIWSDKDKVGIFKYAKEAFFQHPWCSNSASMGDRVLFDKEEARQSTERKPTE